MQSKYLILLVIDFILLMTITNYYLKDSYTYIYINIRSPLEDQYFWLRLTFWNDLQNGLDSTMIKHRSSEDRVQRKSSLEELCHRVKLKYHNKF